MPNLFQEISKVHEEHVALAGKIQEEFVSYQRGFTINMLASYELLAGKLELVTRVGHALQTFLTGISFF
jgi:hypothetical protein